MLARAKEWARRLKRNVMALYFAARDQRTPWHARAAALCVAAYALSPIDLIPDFIPILGYLDDVILLPIAIWFVIRLIPSDLMAEHLATAAARSAARPASYAGAAFIASLWVIAAAASLWWLWPRMAG